MTLQGVKVMNALEVFQYAAAATIDDAVSRPYEGLQVPRFTSRPSALFGSLDYCTRSNYKSGAGVIAWVALHVMQISVLATWFAAWEAELTMLESSIHLDVRVAIAHARAGCE